MNANTTGSFIANHHVNPDLKNAYSRVQCMYIAFDKPDHQPDVLSMILEKKRELFEILETAYHFDLQHFLIPLYMTQEALEFGLNRVVQNYQLAPDDLLIVFYDGHGYNGVAGCGPFRIYGYENNYVWEPIRDMICDSVASDKLFLMDTCFAEAAGSNTNLAMDLELRTDVYTHEMLAAVPKNMTTPSAGPDSFTARLVHIFHDMATNPAPLTIKDLQDRFYMNRGDLTIPPHIHLNHSNRCILFEPCHNKVHAWVVNNNCWNTWKSGKAEKGRAVQTGRIRKPKCGYSQLVLVSHDTQFSKTQPMDRVYFFRELVYENQTPFQQVRQDYVGDFIYGYGAIPPAGLEFRYGRQLLPDNFCIGDLNWIKSQCVDAAYMADNIHVIQVQACKPRKW